MTKNDLIQILNSVGNDSTLETLQVGESTRGSIPVVALTSNYGQRSLKIELDLRDKLIRTSFFNTTSDECFALSDFLEDEKIKISKPVTSFKSLEGLKESLKIILSLLDTHLDQIWSGKKWYTISDELLERQIKMRYF